MHTNPNNEIIGPTVIRRKEKISGLYTSPEGSPAIRANPRMMMAKETAKYRNFRFRTTSYYPCGYICLLQ